MKIKSKKNSWHKSKINHRSGFKRCFNCRRYRWTNHNYKDRKEVNRDDLIYKAGNKKKDKTHIFKSLKQKDLLEETIITIKPTPGDALEEQLKKWDW